MNETRAPAQIELSEVMLAMDVVDTLRHEQSLVERELQSQDREAELIDRLRKIYADQGLAVSDAVIAQGVQAMREDRFTYRPPPGGFQTMLARLYVHRARWARRAGLMVLVLIGIWAGYRYLVVMPQERAGQQLIATATAVENLRDEALQTAVEPGAADRIQAMADDALAAVRAGDAEAAATARQALQAAHDTLHREFAVQVVSRPGTASGVWRYPAGNQSARNYYLIVEAVSPSGQRLELPITSEEDGSVRTVSQWGLRVDPAVFERVKRDKAADGIVNDKIVGQKQRGHLTPAYTIATTGAAITEW